MCISCDDSEIHFDFVYKLSLSFEKEGDRESDIKAKFKKKHQNRRIHLFNLNPFLSFDVFS